MAVGCLGSGVHHFRWKSEDRLGLLKYRNPRLAWALFTIAFTCVTVALMTWQRST
jgi:hypothetical protein